jgi:hypothetical protein
VGAGCCADPHSLIEMDAAAGFFCAAALQASFLNAAFPYINSMSVMLHRGVVLRRGGFCSTISKLGNKPSDRKRKSSVRRGKEGRKDEVETNKA